ncbi:MAG: HAD-IIB family hydrolase [Candidatus Thiodiazotropha sp. (ex Monitilora ramsayi)]|nr:HAD-IIB family hydrolase [Candidatus Thiodiazotropha sp. (ex Monitilora ramsayi)]
MTKGWAVFTDLDGTLLDHNTHDHTPALPALKRLRDLGIPVIPVSSKTLEELKHIREQLKLKGPAVAESGAVIAYPGEKTQIAPPGYYLLRDFLIDHRANPAFGTLGFGDMSLEEVMENTGLSRDDAKRAIKRLASEPFLWQGDSAGLITFRREVQAAKLRLLQGDRFMHLLADTDKGVAVRHVVNHLRSKGKSVTRTIALGDSDNDRDMLLTVDNPVIIRKHDDSHLSLAERPDAIITDQPGPAGWNQAINQLLDQYVDQGSVTHL